MLSQVLLFSGYKLTKSPLFYLLRCKSKDCKQLDHYLDQYPAHSVRDVSENFETAKVVFETLEEVDECVITGANSLSGLERLRCQNCGKRKRYRLRVGVQLRQISLALEGDSAG